MTLSRRVRRRRGLLSMKTDEKIFIEPIKSHIVEEDPPIAASKPSLMKRVTAFFSKSTLAVTTMVMLILDLLGLYSNWSFIGKILGPLKEEKAVIAVRGSWQTPEFETGWYNLPLAVCNPGTQEQIPSADSRNIFFIFCIFLTSLFSFFFLLSICLKRNSYLLRLKTLDKHGGLGEEGMKKQELAEMVVHFVLQDFFFAVTLGWFVYSLR
jgi:hypothetical protein